MAWSILIPSNPDEQDALVAALWEQGTTGIIEEAGGLRAFFDGTADPQRLGSVTGEIRTESDGPYIFKQDDWEPVEVGNRFLIAPPWVDTPTDTGRLRLSFDAAAAFGTGRHETTQLCIEALEKHLKPGDRVVDVGGGSGILSAAATLLGAGGVVTCDVDAQAVDVARSHLKTPVFLGSADGLRPALADLVLANISARVLDQTAFDLQRILKPYALLILSGFIGDNPPKCFHPLEHTSKGDWLCWICKPENVEPANCRSAVTSPIKEWWL